MRIACLQFAPQVGDVDNNLNRADSVLAKANPDDLEGLDLLVLPELAFSGYNFKSLNQISPFLEPQGSGISALWARTTALKYNTNVVVGYPERVDVSPKWPTGPEYYNSTLIINGDGETIANYRKTFLYAIDETWALEGKDGFFAEDIPELGNTAIGICMDLNPYKFEAPWHAFEFAFHVLSVEANLVIITMAWVTREDGRHFSRMPEEPDMETLTYWVQRLEPLIRAESQDELIVVFCNRTGMEDDVVYAGTSSVIGIKDGEVNVYGLLGRSVKDLLVVDTDNRPFAKLVQRSEQEHDTASQVSGMSRKTRKAAAPPPSAPRSTVDPPPKPDSRQRKPSPTPGNSKQPRRVKPQSPKIQIPKTSFHSYDPASRRSPVEQSPEITTPTCPSPTPLDQRPKLTSPSPGPRSGKYHVDTPYPHDGPNEEHPRIFGGHVSIDQQNSSTSSPGSGQMTDKYFWLTTQPPLRSPMESRFPNVYPPASPAVASPVASSLIDVRLKENHGVRSYSTSKRQSPTDDATPSSQLDPERPVSRREETSTSRYNDSRNQEVLPLRPSSPKSRNASRTGRQGDRRPSELNQADLSAIGERLESISRRPGSAMDSRGTAFEEARQGRPGSRDSRSASRIGRPAGTPQIPDDGACNVSGIEIPFMASPGVYSESIVRPQSDILKNREQNISRNATKIGTSSPRLLARELPRTKSSMGQDSGETQERAGSSSLLHKNSKPHIEPDETRTLVWSELSKIVGEVLNKPQSRDASRGRQQDPSRSASFETPMAARVTRAESHGPNVVPRTEQRFASRERSDSVDQKPIRTILAPDAANASGPSPPCNPDDEIVAEIIFHTSKSPPSVQRGWSRQRTDSLKSRDTTPHINRQKSSPPTSTDERRPSIRDTFDEIKVYKAPTPSNAKTRPGSDDALSSTDIASIRTSTSARDSSSTPSPRVFEPKTPKAMNLGLDFDSILSSASDPTSNGEFPPLDPTDKDLDSTDRSKAKSTIW